jgi:hypothetical protein
MNLPLMPKATAVWLVENTTLTFEQISEFCGMHPLEVQGIADGDVANNVVGSNPMTAGQLTQECLDLSQADESVKLTLKSEMSLYITSQKKRKSRYTPVARRQDKPDAIAWLVKQHPEISDAQVSKLIGTTKSTIASIRDRSHWNIQTIKPRDPVLLGLCTQTALHAIIAKIEADKQLIAARAEREKAKVAKEKDKKKAEKEKAKAVAAKIAAKNEKEAKAEKAAEKKEEAIEAIGKEKEAS